MREYESLPRLFEEIILCFAKQAEYSFDISDVRRKPVFYFKQRGKVRGPVLLIPSDHLTRLEKCVLGEFGFKPRTVGAWSGVPVRAVEIPLRILKRDKVAKALGEALERMWKEKRHSNFDEC